MQSIIGKIKKSGLYAIFSRKEELLILICMVILVFFLVFFRISEIPPPHSDELDHGWWVISILRSGVWKYILDPFLSHPYSGPIFHYTLIPSLYFLGNSIYALRFPTSVFGILLWLFTYLFTKKFYDRRTAFLASFILVLLPPYFTYSRMALECILLPFFLILSLYLLVKYEEKGHKKFLYIFALVCGFGISTRIDFVFFIISLVLMSKAGIVFERLKKLGKKDLIIVFLIFLFGSYPMIVYNIKNNFSILQKTLKRFPKAPYSDWDLSDVVGNLRFNIFKIIPNFFKGGGTFGGPRDPFVFNFFLIFFLGSLIFLVFKHLKEGKLNSNFKKDLFIIVNILVFFITLSVLTPFLFFEDHYIATLPLCAIVIGRTFSYALKSIKSSHLHKILFSLLFISFLFVGILSIYEVLFKDWPKDFDSLCVINAEKVVDSVLSINHSIIVIDRNSRIHNMISWLLYKRGLYDYADRNVSIPSLQCNEYKKLVMMDNDDILFVFGNLCGSGEDCKVEFMKAVNKYNKTAILEDGIYSNDDELLYTIYRVVGMATIHSKE